MRVDFAVVGKLDGAALDTRDGDCFHFILRGLILGLIFNEWNADSMTYPPAQWSIAFPGIYNWKGKPTNYNQLLKFRQDIGNLPGLGLARIYRDSNGPRSND